MWVILGAALTAFSAIVLFLFGQKQSRLERQRKACADAITDALAWLEIPYRIRRRLDDETDTLEKLSERIHLLQERLLFHQSWLQVELPEVLQHYKAVVSTAKGASQKAIQEAWKAPPINNPLGMNVGDLGIQSIDHVATAFAEEVRKRLVWWQVWK